MENLMDKSTRVSLLDSLNNARLGTFDEACTGAMQQRCALAIQQQRRTARNQTAACPIPLRLVHAQHRRQGCTACSLSHPAPVAAVLCPAATEFIRVPAKSERPCATVRGLTADYAVQELGSVPLAAQLMGSSTQLLAAAARHLVDVKGAPRIDLNCGESAGRQRRVRLSRAR